MDKYKYGEAPEELIKQKVLELYPDEFGVVLKNENEEYVVERCLETGSIIEESFKNINQHILSLDSKKLHIFLKELKELNLDDDDYDYELEDARKSLRIYILSCLGIEEVE